MLKRLSAFTITTIWISGLSFGLFPVASKKNISEISKPIHVYCECLHSWINGSVANFAIVDLRDGKSFGPVLTGAIVEVNRQTMAFDIGTQTYKGDIGKVEQWQEIPIQIKTVDNRKVQGNVVVVFMVQFIQPKSMAAVSSKRSLPVSWRYSKCSMHTVDLEIFSDEEDPLVIEVRGNHTTVDLNELGIKVKGAERVHLPCCLPGPAIMNFQGI